MGRAGLVLDSSALIALICREPGWELLLQKLEHAGTVWIGTPTVCETQLALTVKLHRDCSDIVEQVLSKLHANVVPLSPEHIPIFFQAFLRFGKGRHPARLNMGDCFTYAIAKALEAPLLFVGEDFKLTDLVAA